MKLGADLDGDGLRTAEEYQHQTNPNDADTDGDTLGDGDEVNVWGTSPLSSDGDGDGLPDAWEIEYLDGIGYDGDDDPDGDTLTNLEEYEHESDPLDTDTDSDGMPDDWEVWYGTNVQGDDANADPDSDGLVNLEEMNWHTDPKCIDSDGDGLPDGAEVTFYSTLPYSHNASMVLYSETQYTHCADTGGGAVHAGTYGANQPIVDGTWPVWHSDWPDAHDDEATVYVDFPLCTKPVDALLQIAVDNNGKAWLNDEVVWDTWDMWASGKYCLVEQVTNVAPDLFVQGANIFKVTGANSPLAYCGGEEELTNLLVNPAWISYKLTAQMGEITARVDIANTDADEDDVACLCDDIDATAHFFGPPGRQVSVFFGCLAAGAKARVTPRHKVVTAGDSVQLKIHGTQASPYWNVSSIRVTNWGGMLGWEHFTLFGVDLVKCSPSFEPTGGDADNTTTIHAFVTPTNLQGEFRFTLTGVSSEPGYCINKPSPAPGCGEDSDAWKDLQFPYQNGFAISGVDRNIAETTADDLNNATVTVNCYDYGAYGQLRAEFFRNGAAPSCAAREEGGSKEYTNIPRDDDENHICDGWAHSVGSAAQDADVNTGGSLWGDSGDGLTRYEEYRGLVKFTVHARLNPTCKDVFVDNREYLPFAGDLATAACVQVQLVGDVYDAGHAINFNYCTAHDVDQHVLVLVRYDYGPWEWGTTFPGIGTSPRDAYETRVDEQQIRDDCVFRDDEFVAHTVIHELCHGIGADDPVPQSAAPADCVMRNVIPECQAASDSNDWYAITVGTTWLYKQETQQVSDNN